MSSEGLRVAPHERGVLRLTLDRPEKRNAITDAMMAGLLAEIEAAGTDDDVRVIVLDGAGAHFCGGFDIVARNADRDARPPRRQHPAAPAVAGASLDSPLARVQTPVVCVVHGWAAGIGFQLALASDFTIAADDARFWEPFAERGFTPDSGATWLLPRRVGVVRARELAASRPRALRHRSRRMGRDPPCCRPRVLPEAVDEVVNRLATGPTVALGLTKWLLHTGEELALDTNSRTKRSRWSSRRAARTSTRGSRRSPRSAHPNSRADDTDRTLESDARRRSTPKRSPRCAAWIEENVPRAWIDAGRRRRCGRDSRGAHPCRVRGLVPGVRRVGPRRAHVARRVRRPRPDTCDVARAIERELAPFNLGRLNPLGLNLAAPALFAHGTEEQRLRFLPRSFAMRKCGASCSASRARAPTSRRLRCRAERDGDTWRITGQKVWTTWAHIADFGVLLARTDPDVPKRQGITYFLLDLHQPGVDVRPLRHITGDIDFNEVFLDNALVPDRQRVGEVGDGWKVANATLSGERQMVSGAGSGGVDRIGGRASTPRSTSRAARAATGDPVVRQELARLYCEEQDPRLDEPAGARGSEGRPLARPGEFGRQGPPRRAQPARPAARSDRAGRGGAWRGNGDELPPEVAGMLRSRANTIEGGTTEVNKNVIGERVLGLPREPDPYGMRDPRRGARCPDDADRAGYETLRVERRGPVGWLTSTGPTPATR